MFVEPLQPAADRCAVHLARGADGRAEFHKRAVGTEQVERLAREAAALRRARHPGVIDLIELRRDDDGAVLVTRSAGTHTLATWPRGSLDEVAGLLVALAETLADLHHLGIAHGAVEPAHVVVDGEGRPVLCGFDRRCEHRTTDDIAALGRLARHLLADDAPRDGGARREPRRRAAARARLVELADQAQEPDEPNRPGARRFAAAVLAAVPGAAIGAEPATTADPVAHRAADDHAHDRGTTPTTTQPDEVAAPSTDPDEAGPGDDPPPTPIERRPPGSLAPRPHERRARIDALDPDGHRRQAAGPAGSAGRLARSAAAVLGLACLVFGGLTAWGGERSQLAPPSIAAPAPTEVEPRPSADGSVPPDPSAELTPGNEPAPDPCRSDPSSCPVVVPGGVVAHDGSRFALGGVDDQLLLLDPRCPQRPAIVLLRPADGTTWLVDRWAGPGDDVAARAGPSVPPGSRWLPRPFDDLGCTALAVTTPDGTVTAIDPAVDPPVDPPVDPTEPDGPT